MLEDKDEILLGDVKALFQSATQTHGPVPLAEDPLAGSDSAIADGTPTGGLDSDLVASRSPRKERRSETPRSKTALPALTHKVENLEAENERLRRELYQYRNSGNQPGNTPDNDEIERLRQLVNQLERALADSNARLRILQDSIHKHK
jgi:predicted RNase H-like nuclease (RuvC/YqgF family)